VKLSEKKYQSWMESLHEGVGLVDPYENIIYVNPAFSRILGYSKDEAIGMNLAKLVPKEEFQKILQGTAKRKQSISSVYEVKMIRKDGELINIKISAAPWISNKGEFKGTIGMMLDITEQRQAEEELRSNIKVLDNINIGIIGFDLMNKIVTFQNKYAIEIFEPDIKPMDYKALSLLLLSDMEDGNVSEISSIPRESQYKNKVLGYSIYCLPNKYLWVFILDITEKARLKFIAETVNTMDNIGYIFSGIRHELGNPLNSLKMTMSVIKNRIEDFSNKKILEYIDFALAEIDRIEFLLRSLKHFNMFESLEPKNVNLRLYLKDFISLVRTDVEEKDITFKTNFPDKELWVYVDSRALQQVLLNILTNSLDAVEGKKNPEIILTLLKSKKGIIIKIIDNGCGIPIENQKNLFMPFYTTKNKGTGLGLVIVKRLLTKMNSTIEIKSVKNKGTKVEIIFTEGKSE
jgi:PAS domain S-box-containing protein